MNQNMYRIKYPTSDTNNPLYGIQRVESDTNIYGVQVELIKQAESHIIYGMVTKPV